MTAPTQTWLTSKRIRAHALILAVVLWSLYLWTIATPGLRDRNGNLKGTDFLHFYTLGIVAAEHRGDELYDSNAQAKLATERIPEAEGIRYLPLYPPQLSIFLVPLSFLSYGWALIAWWACSGAAYGICCYAVWRMCPKLRPFGGTVAVAAIAAPAFFNLIAWGQISAVALACFTLTFWLLRGRREFLAGIFLGCLIFKPQLGLAAAVVFLATGAWRAIAGAILSGAAQLGFGILYLGTDPLRKWFHVLWNVRKIARAFEPRPHQTHCLRTFWEMLVPWSSVSTGLYLVSAIVVLAVLIQAWRRGEKVALELRYSLLLLATVLVSPHLTVYDLVILAPAILLLTEWMLGQPQSRNTQATGTLLYLVYALPLIGFASRWTRIQVSVIAIAGLFFMIWRRSHQGQVSAEANELSDHPAVAHSL